MPSKSSGSSDDKAPKTGGTSTSKRDDKATSHGQTYDPNRPHVDKYYDA